MSNTDAIRVITKKLSQGETVRLGTHDYRYNEFGDLCYLSIAGQLEVSGLAFNEFGRCARKWCLEMEHEISA